MLSTNEVKEIYDIDVGKDFTSYHTDNTMSATVSSRNGLIVVENRPDRNLGESDGPDSRKFMSGNVEQERWHHLRDL